MNGIVPVYVPYTHGSGAEAVLRHCRPTLLRLLGDWDLPPSGSGCGGYKLIVTGHSLGAGTAILMTMLILEEIAGVREVLGGNTNENSSGVDAALGDDGGYGSDSNGDRTNGSGCNNCCSSHSGSSSSSKGRSMGTRKRIQMRNSIVAELAEWGPALLDEDRLECWAFAPPPVFAAAAAATTIPLVPLSSTSASASASASASVPAPSSSPCFEHYCYRVVRAFVLRHDVVPRLSLHSCSALLLRMHAIDKSERFGGAARRARLALAGAVGREGTVSISNDSSSSSLWGRMRSYVWDWWSYSWTQAFGSFGIGFNNSFSDVGGAVGDLQLTEADAAAVQKAVQQMCTGIRHLYTDIHGGSCDSESNEDKDDEGTAIQLLLAGGAPPLRIPGQLWWLRQTDEGARSGAKIRLHAAAASHFGRILLRADMLQSHLPSSYENALRQAACD